MKSVKFQVELLFLCLVRLEFLQCAFASYKFCFSESEIIVKTGRKTRVVTAKKNVSLASDLGS